ncbi:MAG: glycosyltransferase family 39 protein [Candidatus Saccharimonadales bacterium]
MRRSLIRELLLYRYRFIAGLTVFLVATVFLVMIRTDLAPTGLSTAEMQSAATSATFKFSQPLAQSVIDLPYRLSQKLTMSVFGVTEFAIVLPSMVFAILTAVAFLQMVRRWFRPNVALITGLIFVTSAAFLTLARTGFAEIMTTFWLSLLLLAVTNIIHPEGKTKLWFLALVLILPLSLYTPLMIYPIAAITIAGLVHPHVRFTINHMSKNQYAIGIGIMLVLLAPLIVSVTTQPSYGLQLLGVPTQSLSSSELIVNAKNVVKTFFNLSATVVGSIPQPMFGAASFIIIVLGFLKTAQDWHSARSYMLLIWSALYIPLAILNPDKILIALIPAYLYMAIGIETLIREWYKLFPHNPYARLTGLLPLVILLGGIMTSNVAQYFYGYLYGTPTTRYSEQLTATRKILDRKENKDAIMTTIVKPEEGYFYDLLRRDYPRMNVAISQDGPIVRPTIVLDGASIDPRLLGTPERIVTSYKSKSDQVLVRYYVPSPTP